jgi:hypothetical protein
MLIRTSKWRDHKMLFANAIFETSLHHDSRTHPTSDYKPHR